MRFLVFTDLDGTLLNPDDYRYEAALPAIALLQSRRIPVIPVTSKTRAEVDGLRRAIGWRDPFVVENGSGAFVEADDDRFPLADAPVTDGYRTLVLGCDYATARSGLGKLAAALGTTLRGFGDLSPQEVADRTGLGPADVERAMARDFTEPFLRPEGIDPAAIAGAAARLGFQTAVGDRFCHLIGAGAGKGRAVAALLEGCRLPPPLKTVGLGNSPNDLPMLEAVDRAIVVPGPEGPHPELAARGWPVAPAVGARGWGLAVAAIAREWLPVG